MEETILLLNWEWGEQKTEKKNNDVTTLLLILKSTFQQFDKILLFKANANLFTKTQTAGRFNMFGVNVMFIFSDQIYNKNLEDDWLSAIRLTRS